MFTFSEMLRAIRYSTTLGNMRAFLGQMGYPSHDVDLYVLCQPAEFVLAAAQARATIGA